MTDDTEARAIAGRLTEAQRAAVMALSHMPDPEPMPKTSTLMKLKLAWRQEPQVGWRLSALGLRVRAVLAAQQGGGA